MSSLDPSQGKISILDLDDQGNMVDRETGQIVVRATPLADNRDELMPQWLIDQHNQQLYPPAAEATTTETEEAAATPVEAEVIPKEADSGDSA